MELTKKSDLIRYKLLVGVVSNIVYAIYLFIASFISTSRVHADSGWLSSYEVQLATPFVFIGITLSIGLVIFLIFLYNSKKWAIWYIMFFAVVFVALHIYNIFMAFIFMIFIATAIFGLICSLINIYVIINILINKKVLFAWTLTNEAKLNAQCS